MKTVMALCILSITIIFNGCAEKTVCAPIPQKCRVPYTELPKINNSLCDDNNYSCITVKALSNYEAMKAYADTLLSNSQVCR